MSGVTTVVISRSRLRPITCACRAGRRRWTLRDVDLHGQTIPARERVILITGAACRDEREFPEPDRFDVTRKPEREIYFGLGHHDCLGKSLARLEATVALGRLIRRFERIELLSEPTFRDRLTIRGVDRMELSVG